MNELVSGFLEFYKSAFYNTSWMKNPFSKYVIGILRV